MKGFFCKFYWSFPFELVVASNLLTQCIALCCFSITPSFFMSSFSNQLGPCQKHTQGKNARLFLQKVPKYICLLLIKYAKLWRSCCLWQNKICHTDINSPILTFVNTTTTSINMFASLAMHIIMQKMSTECVNSPTKSAYSNNVLCTNLTSLN